MLRAKRIIAFIALLNITLLGLYTKNYSGVFENWINNSLGGVFYVMFFCCVLYLIKPTLNKYKIALIVYIATCLVELSQLSHFYMLDEARRTFVGRTLLGNTFVYEDFIWYTVGALLSLPVVWFMNYLGEKQLFAK